MDSEFVKGSGFYEGRLPAELLQLYLEADGGRSLEGEAKLLRAQVAYGLAQDPPDLRLVGWALELLVKVTRVSTGASDSAVLEVFDRAAAEIVAGAGVPVVAAARVPPDPARLPRRRGGRHFAPSGAEVPVSIGEAAEVLGVSVRQVHRLVSSGALVVERDVADGRRRVVRMSDLQALLIGRGGRRRS